MASNNNTSKPEPPKLDAVALGLPPVIGEKKALEIASVCRATLWRLAAEGKFLTAVIPGRGSGKRGKRVFLTQSLLDFISSRFAESEPPKPIVRGSRKKKAEAPAEAVAA